MPKINVYLPDDLAEAVRVSGVPVSAVCQRALEDAVRRVTAIRGVTLGDLTDESLAARLPHATARARTAFRVAVEQARAENSAIVHTGHILNGLLADKENMANLILRAMEVESDQLAHDVAGETSPEEGVGTEEGLRISAPAANAFQLAVTEATAMGHNYVGCEHLLVGLATEPDGRAGAVLRARGIEGRGTRRAVVAAISGFQAHRTQYTAAVSSPADAMLAVVRQELRPILDRLEALEARTT